MSSRYYRAPWGTKIWVITGLVIGLGLIAAVALPLLLREKSDPLILRLLPTFVIMAVFAGTGLFVVRGFELTEHQLLVRRSFWNTTIELAELESATVDPTACKGAFKTLGNDGLFAMSGRFRSKKLGSFRAFVTAPINSVVLKIGGRTIVISPENPKSIVNELNRRLSRAKTKT